MKIKILIKSTALLFLCLSSLLISNIALSVTWVLSEPDVSASGSNGHTYSGPVSYFITYTETNSDIPLQLLDDPAFFELRDESDNPVDCIILIRAVDAFTREIRIENIGEDTFPFLEGDFHLYVYPGTALDGDGFALGGVGNPFTSDKTEPEGVLTGPFEIDLATPVTVIEEGDDVYYFLDFSVDHLAEPERSLQAADLYPLAPNEGVWQNVSSDYFDFSNDDFSATVRTFRTGSEIIIRLQNISGPEIDFGIYIGVGAALDYATNRSPPLSSGFIPYNDDVGPQITIDNPQPALTNGEPVIFDVNYTDATSVTLSEDDISVFSSGDVTADLSVNVISSNFAQVEFSNFVGEGQIWFTIAEGSAEDSSGDLAPAAGPSDSFEVDIYGPEVVFAEPSPYNTVTGPASFYFTFVDAVSVSLLPDDIIVNTTGDVSYTGMQLINTGVNSRELRFTGLSGEGNLSINIPANVAIDEYFQNSVASEESPQVRVGPLPPMSIAISNPSVSFTVAGPVSYVVSYVGVASISLDPGFISIQASGSAVANTVAVTGSGTNRTVTLSDISGEGAIAIVIAEGSAQDPGANLIAGISSNAFAVGNNDDDGDLVPDGQEEFIDGTDKDDPTDYLDTDKDVVPDFVEEFLDSTEKNNRFSFKDSDEGGTPDYVELLRLPIVTNELDESDDQRDGDNDGLPDYLELKLRLAGEAYDEIDVNFPVEDGDFDSDSDGILDGLEFYLSNLLDLSDPDFYDDFDRDGYFDHHEVRFGMDPEFSALVNDSDFDGIDNRIEAAAGINISSISDSDADRIPDFIEYVFNRSRVNAADNASIYVSNIVEGNPFIDNSSDSDTDGMPDLEELETGFDALRNDTPVAWFAIKQGSAQQNVCAVSIDGDEVELRLMIGNMQTNIASVDWSDTDANILALALTDFDRLKFNPQTLEAGLYEISATVQRVQNAEILVSSIKHTIKITEQAIRLDIDEDGICDDLESSVSKVAQRSIAPLNSSGEQLLGEVGSFFHLGYLASFINEANTMQVPYSVVENFASDLAVVGDDSTDSEFGNLIPRVHFELRNLTAVGNTAEVLLPLAQLTNGLPASANYRLLTPSGWQTFNSDSDIVQSSPQLCENAPVFTNGLNQGARCIRMYLQDGGANDLDGELNGMLVHLGAPALRGATPVDLPDGPGGESPEDPYADFIPGKRKIILSEAGALNPILFLTMLFGMLMRMRKQVIFFVTFFLCFSLPVVLQAQVQTQTPELDSKPTQEKQNWLKSFLLQFPLENFYAGFALGQSGMDGDFSNLYQIKDDSDTGFKLWLDYQFRERWFVELEYANLGETTVAGSAAAIATNVFPAQFSEAVAYQHASVTTLYDYPLPYKNFSIFAKAGLAYADIQSDLNIEVADRFSPSFGLGTQYRFRQKYVARFEYETFSEDSNLLSLGIAMRLAEPKPEEQTKPVEAVTPPPVAEAVPEELVEQPAEQVPQTLEEFIEALEPEEPTVNMEELYADLKASIEPTSLFDKGSATLSRRLMANLDELIYFLDTYPDVRVVITGHASDEGHEYLNENLSRLRAHGAKTYLQANGIGDERVIVRARGEHFPKYHEGDDDYQIRNRRIEFDFYIPKQK